MRGNGRILGLMKNDRGIALLIVLLVTALLTALIFEFAFGTRVSMRSATNFRDSQRAYFLARSGVNFAGAVLSEHLRDPANSTLQGNIEWREWQTVPIVSAGDTELRVRWEDEGGKISIENVYDGNPAYARLQQLYEDLAISQDLLERMVEVKKKFQLLTQLHQFLGDEDFFKVKDFVTVSKVSDVNINTASSEVLQSLGLDPGMVGRVVERRNKDPFKNMVEVNAFLGNTMVAAKLTITSNVFKVNSFATVGGYTKQVEAVITRKADIYNPFTINYWRAL